MNLKNGMIGDSMDYSVLMSVYFKETGCNLKDALNSMKNQTIPPHEIVLVCDGDLTEELEEVISEFQISNSGLLRLIRREKSNNWAEVLNVGLKECQCSLVARMDSDDISLPQRCEKQLLEFRKHPEIDLVGTALGEFENSENNVVRKRMLPSAHDEIVRFAKYRSPVNHATAMFKKKSVLDAGGYQYFPSFEDYYLWMRMLKHGCKFENLSDMLYLMRADGVYNRRGNIKYFCTTMKFKTWMYKEGFNTLFEFVWSGLGYGIITLIPSKLREKFYTVFLRR